MITLRLFKSADPFQQIEHRALEQGEITVGRDPSAGWRIDDQRGDLSRRHCTIGVDGGRLWVRDISSNGVFIGTDRKRAPRDEVIGVAAGETIHIGEFMILLDPVAATGETAEPGEPLLPPVAAPPSPAPPKQPPTHVTDAGMLEAFCRAAGLEASSFAGEDPVGVMSRLGVVYRQVIDDLCGLMTDRAMLKDSLKLDRTTISTHDNNPLKWTPPHRVAVDLLREGETGFLKGAAAFEASFADLRRHGACMLAGSHAAVQVVLDELAPEKLDAAVKRQALDFLSRHEQLWRRLQARHAELASEAGEGGRIERAFRDGYEAELRTIESKGEAA